MSACTKHRSLTLFRFLVGWLVETADAAHGINCQIRCVVSNEEQHYDSVLAILATHTTYVDKWISSNGRTRAKEECLSHVNIFLLCRTLTSYKIYLSKYGLQSQFRNSVYLTSLSLGQFRFLTHTQYIRGLSLFHTLINRNPFHCTQQIYIVSYNYVCKLPLLYRNLIFFISASLIVQRSEPSLLSHMGLKFHFVFLFGSQISSCLW